MHVLLSLVALLATTPPDTSHAYFTHLTRPRADQVQISRDGGPVILIVIDATRPDHLSPYGAVHDTSPNFAKLADDGLVLTNYFVNANWTLPSTTTMLTGLPPVVHRVETEHDRLSPKFVTLAQMLSDHGIPTGAVVGNGNASSAFGLGRGFDFYADTVNHWKHLPNAQQVVDLSIPFIRKHRKDPFFLMLFCVDPHDPYHAPGHYENMFVKDRSVRLIRTPRWEGVHYTAAEIRRMKATYDGAIRYTDTVFGHFFDTLRKLGVYDKATIIVTADHGEAFGEHNVFLHAHHFYDEIERAPFIIKAPIMSVRGAYNPALFEGIDLTPTIAALFNVKPPTHLTGVNIFQHLAQPELNNPYREVVSEFDNFGIKRRMIRTYWKKIIFQDPANRKEFMATVGDPRLLPSVTFTHFKVQAFDMAKDPKEHHDIYTPALMRTPAWAHLYQKIRYYRSNRPPKPPQSVAEKLDPQTYRNLRALGYVQ